MGEAREYGHLRPEFQQAFAHNIPLGMHWDLTWRCDHSCVHCYLTDRRQAELSVDEAIGILDQLADAGTLTILFSGGDPFLRPDAIEILAAARDRGFDVRINTHGNAIDDALADRLAAEVLPTRVAISIYSDLPEVHDAVTLVQGSLVKSLAAARRLKDRGIAVAFKTPVMVHNRDSYHRVGALADEYGAIWELDAQIMNDDQSDFGLCGIGAHATERILATLHVFEYGKMKPIALPEMETQPSNGPTCGAGTLSGHISPDGRLFPCITWRDPLGSLRETPFAELWWKSKKAAKHREILRASYLQDCDGCGFHGGCSYCPGISHAETGDPGRRSEYVCERTHASMAAVEYYKRLKDAGQTVPDPGTLEAAQLLTGGLPTFAERQWSARQAGLAKQADRLPIGLVIIDEPRNAGGA